MYLNMIRSPALENQLQPEGECKGRVRSQLSQRDDASSIVIQGFSTLLAISSSQTCSATVTYLASEFGVMSFVVVALLQTFGIPKRFDKLVLMVQVVLMPNYTS